MQRHKSSKILFMWLSYVQIKNSRVSRSIQVQGAKIDGKGSVFMVLRYYFDLPNNEFVKYRICEKYKKNRYIWRIL